MTAFDRPFARLLLELCRYTYAAGFNDQLNAADRQDALQWLTAQGGLPDGEPTILHGSRTSVACIAAYPDRNIVAYMGTKTQFDTRANAIASIEDWHRNIQALLQPFALTSEQLGAGHPQEIDPGNLGGRVHRGFLEELRLVQAQVVAALLERGGRGRPVYVTGHSQGGAEAALATRALLAGGFPVVATYTFAAPRPGNAEFIRSVPATLPVHRLEFGNDIVPHVPPALASQYGQQVVTSLKALPLLPEEVRNLLDFIQGTRSGTGFSSLGRLCYGSQKTQALRVDLSAQEEQGLFADRLWSLIRHPEHWAEHHHLAGTTKDVEQGIKGNYTALVSTYQLVS